MDVSRQTLLAQLNATLDWWREAGVDCTFDDAPQQWLMAREQPSETPAPADPNSFPAVKAQPITPPPAPRIMIGGDRAGWPAEFSGFADWWMTEPSLDHGRLQGRVPPRGPAAAPLMILVPEPESEDSDLLLSGPHGRLLAAMLAAMGLPGEQVYIASALPRHTPMADWGELAAQGLGDVLRLHIALARPQRMIAFSRHFSALFGHLGLVPSLSGNAPTQTVSFLPGIGDEGGSVPLMVARDLGSLLERPIAKGQFWQHWLAWSAG